MQKVKNQECLNVCSFNSDLGDEEVLSSSSGDFPINMNFLLEELDSEDDEEPFVSDIDFTDLEDLIKNYQSEF